MGTMTMTSLGLWILDVDESQEQQKLSRGWKIWALLGVAHMPTERKHYDYIADEICIICRFWDKSFR